MTKELFDKEDDGVSLGHIHYALSQDPTPAPAPAYAGHDSNGPMFACPRCHKPCSSNGCGDPTCKAPVLAPDAERTRADERNHCECLAHDFLEEMQVQELSRSAQQSQLAELIEDERTAARQEGYNAHLEQLAKHAQPTEDEREHCRRVAARAWDGPITLEQCIFEQRSLVRDEYEAKLLQAESNERCVRSALAVTQKYLNESASSLTAANAELKRLTERVRELELVWAYYERLHDGHSAAVLQLCAPPDHYVDLEAHEALSPQTPTQREGAEPDSDDDADVGAPSCMRCYDAPWGCKVCDPECRLVRKPEQGGGG